MSISTRIYPPNIKPLALPLRIVSIGGGTGLSTLLCGLKKHARSLTDELDFHEPHVEITALVTVSDDGGSSGRLRREFDVLPPGDIRNCMTSLSEDEHLLAQLFQYRFASGRGLKGHSFGNLFLTALNEITGDFARAVRLSSEILAIRGKIYPATSANVTLEAILQDGSVVAGETKISRSKVPIESIQLRPAHCHPLPEALDAIGKADLITLGPGSLYTSVIPNLLVSGITEAIEQSPAMKVYFVNLMWQPGETMNYTASRHVEAIHANSGRNLIDCVVLNSTPIPPAMQRKYARARVKPVENDYERLEELGIEVVTGELLAVSTERKVRHDSDALADVAIELATRSRSHQLRRNGLAKQRK
jgi:uncharacterized cofD-like protein